VICICCSALVVMQSPRSRTSLFLAQSFFILYTIIRCSRILTLDERPTLDDFHEIRQTSYRFRVTSTGLDLFIEAIILKYYRLSASRVRPPPPITLPPHSHTDNSTDCNSFDLLLRVTSQTNGTLLSRSYTIVLTLCLPPRVYIIVYLYIYI